MMTITMLAGLLLLGVFSGFMAGLLGVGGGMILVPFLIYIFGLQNMFGMVSIKFAIASAMAVICFTSLSSARAHAAARAVNWRLVFIFALGILPGGLLASVAFFSVLRAQGLYFVFSGFVLLSAFSMWRGSEAKTRKKLSGRDINKQDPRLLAAADFQRLPAKPWLVLFGAVVGCVSGLVGAGGGFLTVPFQTRFGVPVNRAVATSAATGVPIALINTLGFLLANNGMSLGLADHVVGFIYWPVVFVLALPAILLAPFGAKSAHALPLTTLRKIFALFLFLLALYMFYKGIYLDQAQP